MKHYGTFTLQSMGSRRVLANVPSGETISIYLINEDGDEVLIDRLVSSCLGRCDLNVPTKFVCSTGAEVDII